MGGETGIQGLRGEQKYRETQENGEQKEAKTETDREMHTWRVSETEAAGRWGLG